MNEFTGSYSALKGSIVRTGIYTIGHFVIAVACVMYFTGATFELAATSAVVEPLINALWFFLLDRIWFRSSTG